MTTALCPRRAAPLVAALLAAACHRAPAPPFSPTPKGPDAAGSEDPAPALPLADTATLGPPFLARQRVTASYGAYRHTFEATLQLHDGVLRLLALTPFGTKAFLLEQRGTTVTYTPFMDRDLGFDPRRILADVHRALFLAAPGPAPSGDGERAGTHPVAGPVWERWRGGHLAERRFGPDPSAPEVRVTYDPPAAPGELPARVTLDARPPAGGGYRIEIVTSSQQRL